jgi:hypothetical protein
LLSIGACLGNITAILKRRVQAGSLSGFYAFSAGSVDLFWLLPLAAVTMKAAATT